MSKPKIPLSEQIAEVGREVGLRKKVYPRLVGMGQLARAAADHHLARMRAALASLRRLARNQMRTRARRPLAGKRRRSRRA
jgi:hypothetical protein